VADDIERAQETAQQFLDHSLRHHFSTNKAPRAGRSSCIECEEPIAPARTLLGAVLCIDCQRDDELRARSRGAVPERC